MQSIKTIEGDFVAPKARLAIVASRFNGFIVENLVAGAVDALLRHGLPEGAIELIRVPGAFEIPLAARHVAATKRFDGIIAVGAIIRGATPHFDYVAGECAKGLSRVSLDYGIPMGFGVLTVDTIEQAVERAGTKAGNKGAETALSVLEMISLLGRLEK